MIVNLVAGALVAALGSAIAILAIVVARVQDRARHRIPRPHPLAILALDLWVPVRAELAAFELWIHWWDWGIVRAHWYRQYKRADRKAFAAEMAAPRLVDTGRTLAEIHAAEDGPIVTDDEVAEEWSLRPLSREGIREQWDRASVPMSPDPEVRPGVGWQVPDDWRLPGGRGLMFARRTPWPSAADPVTPAETDDAPPWDIETAQQDAVPAYGVDRCQLAVEPDLAKAMLP